MRASRAYIGIGMDVKPPRILGIKTRHIAAAVRAAGKDA
jgi:hypothetical protein